MAEELVLDRLDRRLVDVVEGTGWQGAELADTTVEGSGFAWLAGEFGLSPFDVDVLVVALAPEVDARYERAFALLQEDPARGRPTVDVVLTLLCANADDRHACLARFAADAPLRRHGLVELVADPRDVAPPTRARYVVVDAGIVDALVGDRGGDGQLAAAARMRAASRLTDLTEQITPRAGWADLVLPDDTTAALREICATVAGRDRVLGTWGFAEKLSRGTGIAALFSGPPGTGKTMAAEVVAGELGLGLYRIDLARVVDKYIGETEKNLKRIFTAAEEADAVLLFDEADVLVGKRSEVRDSHDRYANLEIGYLLQAMESYRGLAILGTNLRHHLDEAFVRRLAFAVHFPFPDEASRRRIWAQIWPGRAPLSDDVDIDLLAGRYPLGGGNIKNCALAAAYLAGDGPIRLRHVLQAVRREYQKMGKQLSEAEFQP
ncbi:ATP-binding protein [Lentzea sp. NPDC058450]|uniref:ATP-binding protein n=1 Tax=Lentzea sp. NPDC058450 TaxID=3346505 RepID=UPI00365F2626